MSMGNEKENHSHVDTIRIEDVPKGRRGKHHNFVAHILGDLERLPTGSALKIPLTEFKGTRLANIRAALNRVTKARAIDVNTSADSESLYVWRPNH